MSAVYNLSTAPSQRERSGLTGFFTKTVFDLAGSGFASTVRLAKSSPEMWTPIFQQNKENVLETLNEYIANLNSFKNLIEYDDFQVVYREMQRTNHIKSFLNGID